MLAVTPGGVGLWVEGVFDALVGDVFVVLHDAVVGVEQHREGLVAAPGLGDLERDAAVEPQGDRGVPQVLAAHLAQRAGGEGGRDGVLPDVAVEVGQVDAAADGVDKHQRVAAGGGEPGEVVAELDGDLVTGAGAVERLNLPFGVARCA